MKVERINGPARCFDCHHVASALFAVSLGMRSLSRMPAPRERSLKLQNPRKPPRQWAFLPKI